MTYNFTITNLYMADQKVRIRVCQNPGMIAGSAVIEIDGDMIEDASDWSLDALDALDEALDDNALRIYERWKRHEPDYVISAEIAP